MSRLLRSKEDEEVEKVRSIVSDGRGSHGGDAGPFKSSGAQQAITDEDRKRKEV